MTGGVPAQAAREAVAVPPGTAAAMRQVAPVPGSAAMRSGRLFRDYQHRQRGLVDNLVRDAAEQHRGQVRASPGADHEQPRVVADRDVDQRPADPDLQLPVHLAGGGVGVPESSTPTTIVPNMVTALR